MNANVPKRQTNFSSNDLLSNRVCVPSQELLGR
jgi:hypothetical protein